MIESAKVRASRALVLVDDRLFTWEDAPVQFRLTYEGELLSDTNKGRKIPARATQKQSIRKVFHSQLRRLWETLPALKNEPYDPKRPYFQTTENPSDHSVEGLAARFERCGYNFVPLVTRDLEVGCSISALMLRADNAWDLCHSGDIDNRIKTLFDALKMPRESNELGDHISPAEDEKPFFCLLEDDSVINHVAVETDALLEGVNGAFHPSTVRTILTVKLQPIRLTVNNLGFG